MTKSVKHDLGKVDTTMLSPELDAVLARVREKGAMKYSRDNWRQTGFKLTRSMAALRRHYILFMAGEDLDEETGEYHLGCMAANIEHALVDLLYRPEHDDRSKLSPDQLRVLKKLLGYPQQKEESNEETPDST